MSDTTLFHQVNILTHVITGSIALLLGVMALLTIKGGRAHKKSGRLFLLFLTFVILTGLMGVFGFGRNQFLLVITMLAGYQGYSGYRTLQTKSNQPYLIDILVASLTLVSALYFLYYFRSIGMIWSPVIIYSTVGYLFFIIAYDFFRYFLPSSTYRNLWLYEHILKMVSAFSGLLSAFTGTVFPNHQPYSQFLPSTFGTLIAIGFMLYVYKNRKLVTSPVERKD